MGYATQDQAEAIFAAIKERDDDRQARMPETKAALDMASVAKERLRNLGWRDGIYCPKDGKDFALIQWGSTGVHRGHYMGDWPDGHIYCGDFLIKPQEVMFKEINALTSDEVAALTVSDADDAAFMERHVQMFGGSDA